MSKRLPTTLSVAAVLAVGGCPFDKTPEPKAVLLHEAAIAAAPQTVAAPATAHHMADLRDAQRRRT